MKLEKFTKNKKQKRIVIGSIVGIILLIGGFTLYKTFALYKEEQSFDVLQGTIPYFVYGDVKLAIKVDGQQQANIPDKKEEYVVEPKCDNDATIEWDYENWGPVIKGISKETRCSLNFVKNNNIGTLGKLAEIDNLDSIETLLTDANIDKLVKSKSGMTYLAKSPTLVSELQSKDSYNDDIKKQILDSTAISEDLKYEAGLPCYLLKNKQVLKAAGDITLRETYTGNANDKFSVSWRRAEFTFSISFQNNKALLSTVNEIDTKKYSELEINYQHKTDHPNDSLNGIVSFGMSTAKEFNENLVNYENFVKILGAQETFNNHSSLETSTITNNIKTTNSKSFLFIGLNHNGEVPNNTITIVLNTIALY